MHLLDNATGRQNLESYALATGFNAGQSVGTDLQSLSYRLSSMTLCQNLVTAGTATTCNGNSFSIVSTNTSQDSYETFFSKDAQADTTDYVNLLDPTAVAKLASNITYTANNVGTYDSALVNWFRPFKASATLTMLDGTKVYTKAATNYTTAGTGTSTTIQANVSNVTTGPAAEGVFFLPNGGTYFKLQQKFEITTDDITNKTSYKVVVAFDPDGLIKATKRELMRDSRPNLFGRNV